jgi:NAD(P)H-nitrite reductase large subunit
MDRCSNHNDCSSCSERLVCRCLQVTEGELLSAVRGLELRTLKEVRQATGAGDGCTACHKVLRRYLEVVVQSSSSSEPICSVK